MTTKSKNFSNNRKEEIIRKIYQDFFLNIEHNSIDIFLCGAASNRERMSCRDELRNRLKPDQNISIYYPEDIFIELMNKKVADLFSLEQFLADNSDLIMIVCESVGSYTELGAFANNEKSVDKVLAIIDNKEKNSKNFVMLGPVKYIQGKNKKHVIFRNSNIDTLVQKVYDVLNQDFGLKADGSINRKKRKKIKDLNLISGQFYFMLILLYFFDVMGTAELRENIRVMYNEKYEDKDFEFIFTAAIKRLYNENLIAKERIDDNNYYRLTSKGFEKAKGLLKKAFISNRDRTINSMRMQILSNLNC